MSISTALFTGISGLNTLGNSMTVVGDNIANVNTIGFKGSRATFEDVLSQSISTAAGTAQVGRGVTLSTVSILFQQGSFESTSEPTDLAIGGKGFFIVQEPNSDSEYYTRAGQFRFDKDGQFINPAGYVVQGWRLDDNGEDVGAITDVVLESFTSPPDNTGVIRVITNLDSRAISATANLSAVWDGTDTPPIAQTNYNYQTALQVYDDLGSSHDLTIYFDPGVVANTWEYIVTCNPAEDNRVGFAGDTEQGQLLRGTITFNAGSGAIEDMTYQDYDQTIMPPQVTGEITAITNLDSGAASQSVDLSAAWDGTAALPIAPGDYIYKTAALQVYDNLGISYDLSIYFDPGVAANEWEYLVTCDPAEDFRAGFNGTTEAGMLLRGVITFNAGSGAIDDVSYERYNQGTSAWVAANLSAGGYPELTALFSAAGAPQTMSLNIGTYSLDGGTTWTNEASSTTQSAAASSTISQTQDGYAAGPLGWTAGSLSSDGYPEFDAQFSSAGGTQTIMLNIGTRTTDAGVTWTNDALSTTQYASASTTIFQTQDGYATGFLQDIAADVDGVITGHYSNGQILELYRVALANFNNPWGLSKEGGNLFRATRASGDPTTGHPGTNGLGRLAPNSLEQSNVDIATEFVKMITVQRGFQANSKIITTTDDMLAELINLKR